MAEFYNSSITTRLIDPVYDRATFRSEYRLQPDTAYLSNLRLLDCGISSTPAQSLNALTGSYGCIKSIQLYDGNQLLDQLLEASIYNAFKTYNHDNDTNISITRYTANTGLGYVATGNQNVAADGTYGKDDIKVSVQNPNNSSIGKSWIALNQMLPFLRAALTLPTNVYKSLRLVVNWKSSNELQDLVADDKSHTLSTYENCVLVADEFNPSETRDKIMGNYNGVSYRPVEHDSVDLPPIQTATTAVQVAQSNSNLVKGFNGKMLHKLLMVQTPTDSTTWTSGNVNLGYANQGSKSLYKSNYQVRVNGANKLTRTGWSGHNQRLGELVDTFGEVNTVLGQNQTFLPEGNNYIEYGNQTMGELDYTGLDIQDRVDELIVEVDRTGVYGDPSSSQRIRLNLFGEVDKQVVMRSDGRYNVIYS